MIPARVVRAPVPPPLSAGAEVLPGYRVVDLLGRGGRVDTYDATSTERECRCVVKVVRPDRLDEPHVREALLTEGRLVIGLSHPHLVRGYELVEGPEPGLVTEALPGATLGALLDDGPLAAGDVAELGRQLASALAYLHRQGWVHLDVKPDNVVVTDGGRAVLIDLGLAARPGRVPRGTGTPAYAAPEQEAEGVVSPAADVWGLAATLLECLTGELPDPDADPGAGPDLARVPRSLRRALAAALHPDPAARLPLPELRTALL